MIATDVKKFEELKQRHDAARTELAKMEVLLSEKEKEVVRVESELRKLGMDPNRLTEQQKEMETILASSMKELETMLGEVERILKEPAAPVVQEMDFGS